MSDEHEHDDDAPDEEPSPDDSAGESRDPQSPYHQEVQHSMVTARVPEGTAQGVFSTGAIVVQGRHEFLIDFLLRMSRPQQLAARIILPPPVMPRFIAALRENLAMYQQKFGPPPSIPIAVGQEEGHPSPPNRGSVQELYEQLKVPDTALTGHYANAVMIAHSATEFCFDFIATFFPRSVVTSRVFLSTPNVPRFLDSLQHSYDQFRKLQDEQQDPPDEPPGETP